MARHWTGTLAIALVSAIGFASTASANDFVNGLGHGVGEGLIKGIIGGLPFGQQPAKPHKTTPSRTTTTRGAPAAEPAAPAAAPSDPAAAVAWYDDRIAKQPKSSALYLGRGEAYARKGDPDIALADFDEAVRLDANSAKARLARASLLLARKTLDGALVDANEAIRLDGKSSDAYLLRGRVRLAAGQAAEASSDFIEVVRRAPKSADGFVGRGLAALKLGDPVAAIGHFNQAIALEPQSGAAYAGRALALEAKGEYGPALADAEVSVVRNPDDRDLREVQARLKARFAQPAASAVVAVATPLPPAPQVAAAPAPVTVAVAAPAPAAPLDPKPAAVMPPMRRVALVIGNGAYEMGSPLPNTLNDADLIAQVLEDAGFDTVTKKTNLGRRALDDALLEFKAVADDADIAMIYFAGHGIEAGGTNYLLPIDARLKTDQDLPLQTVDLGRLQAVIAGAKGLRLVVLDACRDNPFQMRRTVASRSLGRGLVPIEPEPGILVAYAAKGGQTALDGSGRTNSPFAEHLARRLAEKPAIEVRKLFEFVRDDVLEATGQAQQPFTYGSVAARQNFYLAAR